MKHRYKVELIRARTGEIALYRECDTYKDALAWANQYGARLYAKFVGPAPEVNRKRFRCRDGRFALVDIVIIPA